LLDTPFQQRFAAAGACLVAFVFGCLFTASPLCTGELRPGTAAGSGEMLVEVALKLLQELKP